MAVNKVEFGDETLVDLTEDSVTPEKVLKGATFHSSSGEKAEGILSILAESVNEDQFEIDENKKLNLSDKVTNKLTNLDKVDLTSSASDDEVLAWDSEQEKYTPKVAKGGHDMIDTIDDVLSNTDDKKVVDALVVKQFGNRYTERVVMTLQADHDTIGTWQDGEPSTWVVDDTHFLILENFYEADDEEIEFTFLFDSSNSEPIYIGGYQYVSQTLKGGKPCGALCIKCGNAPSVDTQIAVDITRVRFDNVVVV